MAMAYCRKTEAQAATISAEASNPESVRAVRKAPTLH